MSQVSIDPTEEEAAAWRCPNGHKALEDRGDHAHCYGCERVDDADPEVRELTNVDTGEFVPWAEVEIDGELGPLL